MRWKLFLLGVFKIPIIGFVRPKLLHIDDTSVEVLIRFRRRTKNHLNSMYFGTLAVGADIAAGIQAFYFTEQMGKKVSLAFKGMKGEFIKRAESDVTFKSNQGSIILSALAESKKNKSRVNVPIEVTATDKNNEVVAIFEMELSLRVKV
ncbi:MAG: DUF4442 domain-containing protein [Crocinitomicaceae bacterium]|nr:DUF4442 domain-containing protein [Crocinitomicaceae bacterium]